MIVSKKPSRLYRWLILLVAMALASAFVYVNLYSHTVEVTRSLIGIRYDDSSDSQADISLHLHVEKRLYFDDLIDGSITINGKTYDISNHQAVFTGSKADGSYYDPVTKPLFARIKDRLHRAPYEVKRIIIDTDKPGGTNTELTLYISRDFTLMCGDVQDDQQQDQFAAPASSMEEATDVTKRLLSGMH